MEGRPEDIANIKRIFPLEKCRKHLKIIHLLYKHGIEKKAQAPCMYDLLESGYRSAMVGFLLTGDYSNKKQYRDEALKFAKTALRGEIEVVCQPFKPILRGCFVQSGIFGG